MNCDHKFLVVFSQVPLLVVESFLRGDDFSANALHDRRAERAAVRVRCAIS
jgi:hypothetical protein